MNCFRVRETAWATFAEREGFKPQVHTLPWVCVQGSSRWQTARVFDHPFRVDDLRGQRHLVMDPYGPRDEVAAGAEALAGANGMSVRVVDGFWFPGMTTGLIFTVLDLERALPLLKELNQYSTRATWRRFAS